MFVPSRLGVSTAPKMLIAATAAVVRCQVGVPDVLPSIELPMSRGIALGEIVP